MAKIRLINLMHCTAAQMHFHLEADPLLATIIKEQWQPLRNYFHHSFRAKLLHLTLAFIMSDVWKTSQNFEP